MTKDGDAAKVNLNRDEQRKLYGRVLSHNHPQGGSFTLSDVSTACLNHASELRAVSAHNTFSLRGGNRGLDPRNFSNISKAVHRLAPGGLTPDNAHAVWKQVAAENGLNYVVS